VTRIQANELKDRGNKAFAAKDYDSAIQFFSQAIAIDPKNHVLYSNRSAANAGKKWWNAALEDAEQVRQTHCLFAYTLILSLIA
jgi:stress-induced-phosphoprotein 1